MKKLLTFFLTALLTFSVGWAETVRDWLSTQLTGVTGTSYTSFSGKKSNSDAVYAGYCAGGNNSIQLRSSNNNSGIVTTASGGNVRKITVTWNTSTQSGRTLNIYGKSSPYSAATDLYDTDSQGTLLGTIVRGTSTELTVEGDYAYIGFRSNSGAMYLTNVFIEWEIGGASAVAAPTFTPGEGEFVSEQDVVLSSEASGASIYYTLDGTEPTTSSTLYTAPIHLTQTTTIKAIAVLDGEISSVASATYTRTGVASIAEALASPQGSNFTFTGNAVVTYQSPNKQYTFIKDDSGGYGLIFGYNQPELTNGDLLTPNWTATNTIYKLHPRVYQPLGTGLDDQRRHSGPCRRDRNGRHDCRHPQVCVAEPCHSHVEYLGGLQLREDWQQYGLLQEQFL